MRGSLKTPIVSCGVLLLLALSTVAPRAQDKTEAVTTEPAKGKKIAIAGKVVGPDGAPVQAKIVIRGIAAAMQGRTDDSTIIPTDEKGVFSSQIEQPVDLPPQLQQFLGQATVAAPGFVPANFSISAADPEKPIEVKLRKGVPVSGLVKDGNGAPVPGLRIQLNGILEDALDMQNVARYVFIPKVLWPDFTAVTGADGRWTLDNLLPNGRAWLVLNDPKWAQHRMDIKVGEGATEAPDVVARPGSTLRGKVMREDGTPAAKVAVVAVMQSGSGSMGEAVSGEDGSFEIHSLGAGAHGITVIDTKGEWVINPVENIVLKEGVANEAPPVVMSRGALIQGTVTDAATGAPLPGVQFNSIKGNTQGTSDAKGRYSMRVAPGKVGLYVMGKPLGYLYPETGSPSKQLMLTLEKGETKTLDWKLSRGVKLSGTIKVDAGTQAKLPDTLQISFREVGSDRYWDSPSAEIKNNAWTIDGLSDKSYKLITTDEEWEVVAPATLAAPQPRPIEVLLRHVKLPTLTGKVVTRDGKPVEKVKIDAQILIPAGENSWTSRQADVQTGPDGTFNIPKLKPTYQVTLSASREGYKYLNGGEADGKSGTWTMKEIVMLPLHSRVAGRVLGVDGKPVAGARILSPDGNPISGDSKMRITSDAQGRFDLPGLPEGEVTVIAANAQGAATVRTKSTSEPATTADFELKLRPHQVVTASDIDRAYGILDDVWETSRGSNWYQRSSVPSDLIAADFDAALDLARSGDDKKPIAEDVLAQMITKLIEADPARAIEWAPTQLPTFKDDYRRLHATVEVALAAVKIKPELAAKLLADARTIPIQGGNQKTYGPSQLAALEARLGHTEAANKLADEVLTAIKAGTKTEAASMLGAVAEVFAKGSAALAMRALAEVTKDPQREWEQTSPYSRAIEQLAKHDVAGAMQVLEALGKLENSQADYAFAQAARSIIKQLRKTDPKAAVALAKRIDSNYRGEALVLAARSLPKAEAISLLREAAAAIPQHHWNGGVTLGAIARQTYELDPEASKEILQQIRTSIENMKRDNKSWREQQGATSIAAYAMALSRVDPVESRLMLEEEWAFTRGLNASRRGYNTQSTLAVAMASVDPERALELSWQVESQNHNPNAKTDLSPQFLQQRIIEPLGLQRTGCEPTKYFVDNEIAPTEINPETGTPWRGIVHDEAAREWQAQTGGACGNAGVFSTAHDLARFAALWLHEGAHEGRQFFHPDDVSTCFSDTVPEGEANSDQRRGWCWQIDANYITGENAPQGSAGHTGFTGPSLWLHRETGNLCIILNNRVHPTRNGPNRMPYHRVIADAFLAQA